MLVFLERNALLYYETGPSLSVKEVLGCQPATVAYTSVGSRHNTKGHAHTLVGSDGQRRFSTRLHDCHGSRMWAGINGNGARSATTCSEDDAPLTVLTLHRALASISTHELVPGHRNMKPKGSTFAKVGLAYTLIHSLVRALRLRRLTASLYCAACPGAEAAAGGLHTVLACI